MIREDFDNFCGGLNNSENVVQWGNSSVWKIGGKIFAIHSIWGEGSHGKISFKCHTNSFAILTELPGIIPAPYLARAKWVQLQEEDALYVDDIHDYIESAYFIIATKLTKKLQAQLGIRFPENE